MGQTDLFGTFLDALQSSSVDRSMSAFARSDMSRAYRPVQRPSQGPSSDPVHADSPTIGATSVDPTDQVFLRLAELVKSGTSAVELTSLIPDAVSSLGLLLQAISKLEAFGIVERTGDNRIALTNIGKELAQSVP